MDSIRWGGNVEKMAAGCGAVMRLYMPISVVKKRLKSEKEGGGKLGEERCCQVRTSWLALETGKLHRLAPVGRRRKPGLSQLLSPPHLSLVKAIWCPTGAAMTMIAVPMM